MAKHLYLLWHGSLLDPHLQQSIAVFKKVPLYKVMCTTKHTKQTWSSSTHTNKHKLCISTDTYHLTCGRQWASLKSRERCKCHRHLLHPPGRKKTIELISIFNLFFNSEVLQSPPAAGLQPNVRICLWARRWADCERCQRGSWWCIPRCTGCCRSCCTLPTPRPQCASPPQSGSVLAGRLDAKQQMGKK